jgi:signal transduction histidine kinase
MKSGNKSNMIRDYMIFFISFFVISLTLLYYFIYNTLDNRSLIAGSTSTIVNSKLLLPAHEILIYIILPVALILMLFILISGIILIKYRRKIIKVEHFIDNISANTLNIKLIENFSSTELRVLAKKINDMIDRLDLTFSRMRHFASIVSHELKTPLTIIRGELEIALHSKKDIEEYQVIIASSLDEVLRLNNVVNALLDLSRADEGRISMNLNRENISKLIEDIAEDATILAESKNIFVESQIEFNIYTLCDVARLHQAFLNLVDNAIKYTPQNGRMSISLKRTDGNIEVSVSDTGHGIPKEAIPNIFDRFYRLNSREAKGIQGSGLGLSIVKWIIDAHNGRIVVSSVENQGSEFKVIIPVVEK